MSKAYRVSRRVRRKMKKVSDASRAEKLAGVRGNAFPDWNQQWILREFENGASTQQGPMVVEARVLSRARRSKKLGRRSTKGKVRKGKKPAKTAVAPKEQPVRGGGGQVLTLPKGQPGKGKAKVEEKPKPAQAKRPEKGRMPKSPEVLAARKGAAKPDVVTDDQDKKVEGKRKAPRKRESGMEKRERKRKALERKADKPPRAYCGTCKGTVLLTEYGVTGCLKCEKKRGKK